MIFTIALDYFFVFQAIFFSEFLHKLRFQKVVWFLHIVHAEDRGVDRTVIDCRQNQLGQMADFPSILTF